MPAVGVSAVTKPLGRRKFQHVIVGVVPRTGRGVYYKHTEERIMKGGQKWYH